MDKLNLKPEELTFANILENNYTILDINETLAKQNTISTGDNLLSFSTSSSNDGIDVPSPLDASTNNLYNDEIIKKKETLENLLF